MSHRKPTVLKELMGNPGRRPLPKNEPRPDKGNEIPEPPRWLGTPAKKIWPIYAPSLWKLGLLTELDVDALATYCEARWMYELSTAKINQEGPVWISERTGYAQQSAWVGIRNTALKQMESLWAKFGMTPVDRTRLGKVEELEADLFEEFLSNGAG